MGGRARPRAGSPNVEVIVGGILENHPRGKYWEVVGVFGLIWMANGVICAHNQSQVVSGSIRRACSARNLGARFNN